MEITGRIADFQAVLIFLLPMQFFKALQRIVHVDAIQGFQELIVNGHQLCRILNDAQYLFRDRTQKLAAR